MVHLSNIAQIKTMTSKAKTNTTICPDNNPAAQNKTPNINVPVVDIKDALDNE